MKRLFFILALVCAPLAYGQGGVPASPIYFSGPTGRPLAGATVTVCTSAGTGFPCAPLASIFTCASLTACASPNPVTTDGNGNIPVIFAAPGVYILSVTGSGITPTLVTATVAGTGGGNVVASGSPVNGNLTKFTSATGITNTDLSGDVSTTGTSVATLAATIPNAHAFSGTLSSTGTFLCKNFEQVLCVDTANTAGWGAAGNCTTDINVCLAAAYTALPATGGRIRIASSASTYNMSTAFSATVAGKPVLIEGDPGGAVIINWTPTNGTAFTFDTRLNANQHPIGMGMRDLVLTTSGAVSSTGITLGNTNSAEGYEFQRLKIENFITGVAVTATSNLSFANKFDNISFRNLTFGIVGASGTEMGKIFGGSFFNVGTGISGGGDWLAQGTSCDDPGAGGCVGNSVIVCWVGGHFENPGLGLPTYVNSNGTVIIYGGEALDDVTSGTNSTSWFTNTGIDTMVVDGLDLISGGRSMVTNPVFSFGANGRGALRVYNKSSALLGAQLYAANAFQFNKITDMSFDLNGVLIAAIPGPIKLLEVAAPVGVAATDFLYGDSTAHCLKFNANNGGASGCIPQVIASGTTTLTANAALAAVTSQAANTTAATGALTTDAIEWSFATAPTAGDSLCIVLPYVTAGNVNFVRTNPTAAAQNVSALVINWRILR